MFWRDRNTLSSHLRQDDILIQTTALNSSLDASAINPTRVHIRFAHESVSYPLETFKTSRQLIAAIFDALVAHKSAYEKCNILHGDIKPGSILLKKGGGGILNDWDLAKRAGEDSTARRACRTGTWEFMSVELLRKPRNINSVQDDMESFFWMVPYHILRYMNHTQASDVKAIMEAIFEEQHQANPCAPICGGLGKRSFFLCSWYHLRAGFTVEGNNPIQHLLFTLTEHWADWYTSLHRTQWEVSNAIVNEGRSREDAIKRHPFDSRNLAMRNHDCMIEAFEKVLAMTTWPIDDAALDHLPQKNARKSGNIRTKKCKHLAKRRWGGRGRW